MSNVSTLQTGKIYNVFLLVIRSTKFLGNGFTHMVRIMVLVFVFVKGFYLPHVVYQRLCIVLHCIASYHGVLRYAKSKRALPVMLHRSVVMSRALDRGFPAIFI